MHKMSVSQKFEHRAEHRAVKKFDTLAQFVFETREKLGLSQSGLAKRCNLPVEDIQNIESGIELFLSSTVRQKLAKGLKVSLDEVKLYEKKEDGYTFPWYVETFYFDDTKEWMIYVSHEGTVSFTGSKIVKTAEEIFGGKYEIGKWYSSVRTGSADQM